jgi:hypothetical protein
MRLIAKALKVTAVIDAEELAAIDPPVGAKTVPFEIAVDGQIVSGSFNAKSARRAISAAKDGDHVIVVQGKLIGNTLAEAGIIAQPRKPKEAQDGR